MYGKCDKGHVDRLKSLCGINRKALVHWEQCRAVGRFPRDEIVERNAGILQRVRDHLSDERERRLYEWLKAISVRTAR